MAPVRHGSQGSAGQGAARYGLVGLAVKESLGLVLYGWVALVWDWHGVAVSEGNGRLLWGLARMCGAWQSWSGVVCMGNVGHGSRGTDGIVWLWHCWDGRGYDWQSWRGWDRRGKARAGSARTGSRVLAWLGPDWKGTAVMDRNGSAGHGSAVMDCPVSSPCGLDRQGSIG